MERKITCGDFDKALRVMGFERRAENGHVLYQEVVHEALIALPNLPEGDRVLPQHYVTARVTVDGRGVADENEFERAMKARGDLPAGIRTVV